jgi:hypothetical protein
MTKMGHIIEERWEVGILLDADILRKLTLLKDQHMRKAQYYHSIGEEGAASHQISCWYDCDCWIALVSGLHQPPPPRQPQYYLGGKLETPPKEISEFDLLLSRLRSNLPEQLVDNFALIGINYRKACDLFYLGEQSRALAQLRMGWQMHQAIIQSQSLVPIDPPYDPSLYFAPFINPEYNIRAPLSRKIEAELSIAKVHAAASFEIARQEYTTGRINTANYYLHKWWTESKEIANLEKTAFSEVLHTADYYFGNGDDVPPDAALVPRKPKPGADPTAGSLPLPKSNQ